MRLHNGPPPTPTAILEARGSPKASARRKAEDSWTGQSFVSLPSKDSAALDPVASAKWDELTEHLAALGVLSFIDKHVLHRYCVLYSRWSAAEDTLRKRGGMCFPVKNDKGEVVDVRVFPEVYISARLFDQLLKIEDRFGLSPASRASLRTRAVMDMAQREEDNLIPVDRDKSRFFDS